MKLYNGYIDELQLKLVRHPFLHRAKISKVEDAYQYFKSLFIEDIIDVQECFYVLYLNRANNVTGWKLIGMGSLAGTVADCSLIIGTAILSRSASIILCHNHPSGYVQPSDSDIKLTEKIKQGCKLFDIEVLDHLIITNTTYYSFANEGKI